MYSGHSAELSELVGVHMCWRLHDDDWRDTGKESVANLLREQK